MRAWPRNFSAEAWIETEGPPASVANGARNVDVPALSART